MKTELPRGEACYGCPHLEMESTVRGWCTLEVGIVCQMEIQSSASRAKKDE